MQIIADSGSTKTTWHVLMPDNTPVQFRTEGINPVRDDVQTITGVVAKAHSMIEQSFTTHHSSFTIHFYGAGCTPVFSPIVADVLGSFFPNAVIEVDSDMLGAARALCGHEAGIACILGTGANSCLYDGSSIIRQVSPLGWILGDEGSGAVLGRTLLSDALKNQLPDELCGLFLSQYDLNPATAIEHVYRQPQPNRWLASLVPFIVEHRAHPAIQSLLSSQFRSFFRRNISPYDVHNLPVHFVGGIAYQFQHELSDAAQAEGYTLGNVIQEPISRLVTYHQS